MSDTFSGAGRSSAYRAIGILWVLPAVLCAQAGGQTQRRVFSIVYTVNNHGYIEPCG